MTTTLRLPSGLTLVLPVFLACTFACGAAMHPTEAAATQGASHADHYPDYGHPTLPKSHSTWPGLMTLIVIGMFVAAASVGMVVLLNLPDEPPPPADEHGDHAHDHHVDPHQGHH